MNNAAPQKQAKSQTTYSLKEFSVLVAEDYDFMQGLISSMLKAFGVGNIMICNNARQAQELLTIADSGSKGRSGGIRGIDMVLADWMMPDGSGSDLIKWVRGHQSESIKFMPIMLVSAFTSEDVIFAARDLGANEALVKPLSGEKLASRILSVIDNPRPFVKAPTFFGPDRRRREVKFAGEDRRKMKAEQLVTHTERI